MFILVYFSLFLFTEVALEEGQSGPRSCIPSTSVGYFLTYTLILLLSRCNFAQAHETICILRLASPPHSQPCNLYTIR